MKYHLYIGGYTPQQEAGIRLCTFDACTGALEETGSLDGIPSPSYVLASADGRNLYAVSESEDGGSLYSFAAADDGALTLLSELPTSGNLSCHIAVDAAKEFLIVCNYGGGTADVYRLGRNGAAAERTFVLKLAAGTGLHSHPHAHFSAFPKGFDDLVILCDLGTDSVLLYHLDRVSGALCETGRIRLPDGSGPRHLIQSPADDSLVYLVCELSRTVHTLRISETGGSELQRFSGMPAYFSGEAGASAIRTANGCVYAGMRVYSADCGTDCTACFAIGSGGLLQPPVCFELQGSIPRDLMPLGNFLLAACQNSRTLELVLLSADGTPAQTVSCFPMPQAVSAIAAIPMKE